MSDFKLNTKKESSSSSASSPVHAWRRHAGMGFQKCEQTVKAALKSGRVRRLLQGIPSEKHAQIICRSCEPDMNARAYYEVEKNDVCLCHNVLQTTEALEEALCHELVHAYDANVKSVNFREGTQLACSEIRAAFWGECAKDEDVSTKRACVYRTALAATRNHFGTQAHKVVERMMDRCFTDQAPWALAQSQPFPTSPHQYDKAKTDPYRQSQP